MEWVWSLFSRPFKLDNMNMATNNCLLLYKRLTNGVILFYNVSIHLHGHPLFDSLYQIQFVTASLQNRKEKYYAWINQVSKTYNPRVHLRVQNLQIMPCHFAKPVSRSSIREYFPMFHLHSYSPHKRATWPTICLGNINILM